MEPLLEGIVARDDPGMVGVVLSGSAARGLATAWSDLDVYVVWEDDSPREVTRSPELDEIPLTIDELEDVPPFGSDGWWHRWSFAWARVLRDDLGGRIGDAVRRQATLTPSEQFDVLAARLDGYINFAYRCVKSDRDGCQRERRLDAVESVPWLLDVVFALAGRVRPYNKYLAWELREHPLPVREWAPASLLPQLDRILDGDPDAVRAVFAVVDRECRALDAATGSSALGGTIDAWGGELDLLR